MDRHNSKGLGLALGVGVGLGLIAGAALTAVTQQPKELTNEQIIQKARTLGMIPLSEMPKAAAQAAAPPKAEPAGSPAPAPSQAAAPAAAQAPAQAAATAPAQPPAPPPPARVTISVEEGAVFSDVVTEMEQAGLIKDPDAFMARAQETGAVTRIRVGPHAIDRGADADQILAILTSPANE